MEGIPKVFLGQPTPEMVTAAAGGPVAANQNSRAVVADTDDGFTEFS